MADTGSIYKSYRVVVVVDSTYYWIAYTYLCVTLSIHVHKMCVNYFYVYLDMSVCDCVAFYILLSRSIAWCSRTSGRRWAWIVAGSWYVTNFLLCCAPNMLSSPEMRTPLYTGHLHQVTWVSAIEGFHCQCMFLLISITQGSAAAPIARSVLDFFLEFDMPIYELYGMSESTGPQALGLAGQCVS